MVHRRPRELGNRALRVPAPGAGQPDRLHDPCHSGQLKILQEVITLLVFVPFAVAYMKEADQARLRVGLEFLPSWGSGVFRFSITRAVVEGRKGQRAIRESWTGVVIVALEGEEVVDGRDGGGIGGGQTECRPAGKRFDGVRDGRTRGIHDRGAGHLAAAGEAGRWKSPVENWQAIVAMWRRICCTPAESASFRCSLIRPPSGSGVKRWVDVY